MMKKWKTGTIVVALLTIALSGWHIGTRWNVFHKLNKHPETKHRVAVVPTELDLSEVHVRHETTYDLGYAEFSITSDHPIHLKSSRVSASIRGTSKSLFMGFVPPFDPSTADANSFKKEFCDLPDNHRLRRQLTDPNATFLDLEIYTERSLPDPFWKTVFRSRADFALHMMPLALKASNVGLGMHSVYTYQTPNTRGLIRMGVTATDMSKAHVYIENRSGTQGAGMVIQLHDKKEGDVMKILPIMLKTFLFTAEHLDSQAEAIRLIAHAGIVPSPEDHELD